ncbi:hypothetical protein [Paenibacillus sp. HW567]|uniref:hypothetical protein n=1 Tax=Paenibacillus sp. HW567 TaxID=1034769 RepID=UPI00037B9353|nr:hypothetical protein [Paenibacillus sp. HW567]
MSVNDYLDLYNYAKSINDEQWQADIIESLKNFKETSEEQRRIEGVTELWNRFDHINLMLMELFDKLKDNEAARESGLWKERIWELKLERITIAKQIQERYIKIK